jgi:CheY-like chemotaxis protein
VKAPTKASARSVLLVEDDPDDVELLLLVLGDAKDQADFEVAKTGAEAMDRLTSSRSGGLPHFVLLDLNLPMVRGDEVLAFMKRDPVLKSIPVAVLTSSDAPLDRDRCGQHGCIAYLVKPKDLRGYRDLGRVVLRILQTCWAS